jgi:aminopeptidase N
VITAVSGTLKSNALDAAFKAEAIILPIESMIGDRMEVVDPDAIHEARRKLQKALLAGFGRSEWKEVWESNSDRDFELTPAAKGRRRLKNVALDYLMAEGAQNAVGDCWTQYQRATNMTDRLAALKLLADSDSPSRTEALADFYDRYQQDPLVIDKWFAVQAAAQRPDTAEQVSRLLGHPAFSVTNPNRLRSITAYFGGNQWAFHKASGEGYRLLADLILAADKVNPQVAARQLPPLGRWRRFDEKRAALMRAELERIVATPGLSKDVYEQASKSLA